MINTIISTDEQLWEHVSPYSANCRVFFNDDYSFTVKYSPPSRIFDYKVTPELYDRYRYCDTVAEVDDVYKAYRRKEK